MNDRELLELAAKAYLNAENFGNQAYMLGFMSYWNPLKDDGDALRLAVELRLQVTPGTYNKDECSAFNAGAGEANVRISYMQDSLASTRRAIVMAAAMIAENFQNCGN